ncbi:hypothetical protein [Halobacillus yeomjeoni]|uniref:Uncharacterized protein n=1 Tax=Halobacillus yeomjeoni TaxID=311194 RepID=A0A931HXR5_9BACI|nr:hypothetical protein [Halobacillus yeomjeoni]MBH0231453.1 hypothetical protein [Halobacillus yeomjeoni]
MAVTEVRYTNYERDGRGKQVDSCGRKSWARSHRAQPEEACQAARRKGSRFPPHPHSQL